MQRFYTTLHHIKFQGSMLHKANIKNTIQKTSVINGTIVIKFTQRLIELTRVYYVMNLEIHPTIKGLH